MQIPNEIYSKKHSVEKEKIKGIPTNVAIINRQRAESTM